MLCFINLCIYCKSMISSGNLALDRFLDGGFKKELTLIYGPAASGKTTIGIVVTCDLLKKDKKVVFLDTESGFSIERFMQICGAGYLLTLDRLLILKANNFEEQCKKIDMLMNIVDVDLIIVDSLSVHYRREVKENPKDVNNRMDRQLRILSKIAKGKTPIIVTNQVSTNPEDGEIKMVGGEMVKNWCNCLIELKKDPRRICLKKPEERDVSFEIINEGIQL